MRATRSLTLLLALLGAPALGGCDDLLPEGADRVAEDDLVFARADPDAPALDALEVSFWAKPGETRGAAINYVGIPEGKYRLCMEFTVPAGALLRHPDGRAVQPGDSVRITVRAVDPEAFRFEFAPGGLRFDPANPARLRVSYWWADRDYDGDGRLDRRDESIEASLGFWRQETPGAVWERMATERLPELHELRAGIPGFTRYAVASTRGAPGRDRSD
ncbi:MAG TPA: hypothetical protein VHG51_17225 [Longimicrobiaceae bacterium]|nr:hypothetical protein [Longimicrobiaceae bacterium]